MEVNSQTITYVLLIILTLYITSVLFPELIARLASRYGAYEFETSIRRCIKFGLGFLAAIIGLFFLLLRVLHIYHDNLEIISDDLVDADSINSNLQNSVKHVCEKCGFEKNRATLMIEKKFSGKRIKAYDQNQLGEKLGFIVLLFGIGLFIAFFLLFFYSRYELYFLGLSFIGCLLIRNGVYAIIGSSQQKDGDLIEVYTCIKCQHTWENK